MNLSAIRNKQGCGNDLRDLYVHLSVINIYYNSYKVHKTFFYELSTLFCTLARMLVLND